MGAMGLGPTPKGSHGWPAVLGAAVDRDRGTTGTLGHGPRRVPPRAPMAPPSGGGEYGHESKFIVNLLVNLLVI